MVSKNGFWIVALIIILVVVASVIFIILRGNEDSWIKDSRGIYVMHGNPSSTPDNVMEQQTAIGCASALYAFESLKNISFNSQCLGTCSNYVIDIVNVPRTNEDDDAENQCADYISGKVKHFIELNKQGNIVRIV